MSVDWFFDFISPYAYLQFKRLGELPSTVDLRLRPVVFAGLLQHFGQLGPAEISPKRVFTYRHVLWLARRQGVNMRMPAGHPFNPVPLLRLSIAANNTALAVGAIFDYVWSEQGALEDESALDDLAHRLDIRKGLSATQQPEVKAELHDNGRLAIQAGVFGVPTFVYSGIPLWGQDAIEMVNNFEADPELLESVKHDGLSQLPSLVERARP